MRIDQRNAGASVTNTNGSVYPVDRFPCWGSASSKYTAQQSSTAPSGFVKSLLITSSSAYSVGSSDYFAIQQRVEGFNIADLGWGTSDAQPITITFRVRSSLTGTFGGSVKNGSNDRSYPFTYTISSANTYETKTVTIAGDTSGTWYTTNDIGLTVTFGLGIGSSLSGTSGAWASANYWSATGATSVVGTNGATFYITGVQLEVGSTATPFERRLYGQELANCQRYYWQRNSETSYAGVAAGGMNGASSARFVLPYPVPMRSAATVSITNIGNMIVNQGASDLIASSLSAYANSTTAMLDIGTTTSGTLGRGATLIYNISSSSSIQASAEL
jgi:hypothetical protein